MKDVSKKGERERGSVWEGGRKTVCLGMQRKAE